MRIASQNVAKRLPGSGEAIVSMIADQSPDVIALQEITLSQVEGWCALLSRAGYESVVRAPGYGPKGGAPLASRTPIAVKHLVVEATVASRVAAEVIDGIGVASVYFPTGIGAAGWLSLHDGLMQNPITRDFVLIGDFQMVVAENEISSGTFPRWRRDPSFVSLQKMLEHWRDAFRTVRGPYETGFSHLHNSGARWLNDHALIPPQTEVLDCTVDWSPIIQRLSDHATLTVEIRRSQV